MKKLFEQKANKLLYWLVKKEIRNPFLLRFFWFIYSLLSKNYTYKNTYSHGERHHFIPVFLLRNFNSSSGLIYEYQRGGLESSEVSIKKEAAFIKDFYVFKDVKGKLSDFQEKKLFAELLEKITSIVFEKIKKDPLYKPTDLEESAIASFVAHQITRTPLFRQKINFLLYYLISEGLCQINNFGDIDFLKAKIVYNGINIDMISFRRFVLLKRKSLLIGTKNHELGLSLLIAENMAKKIFRKTLVVEQTEQGAYFVISDNPAIIIDYHTNRCFPFEWWRVSDKNISIFMPISPSLAMVYASGQKKYPKDKMDKNNVQTFNLISMICSLNKVYSHLTDKIIQQ
jgi:hypothetical protein